MDIKIIAPEDPAEAAAVLQVLRRSLTVDTIAARIKAANLSTAIASRGASAVGAVSFSEIRDVHWDRTMYVHDLITVPNERGAGVGAMLLAHVADRARKAGCGCLRLCSGLDRSDAHRFYTDNGFFKSSVQFVMHL